MKRRVTVVLFAVAAVVGLSVGPARAATVLVVDNHTSKARCHAVRHGHGTVYPTIQAAVAAADPGDRIRVCPGTYAETVVVNQKLTIEGAKAGVDARWRTGTKGESIVTLDADHPDPAAADGLVQLGADGITWDGFLVADNILGAGISTSKDASGYQIRNTIFNDNGLGLYLHSKGERKTSVRNNRFHANNEFEQPGAGTGIYSELGVRCVLIADNLFEQHNEAGILFADSVATQQCIRVERNKSIDDHTFAAFYASSHLRLVANTVRSDRSGPPMPDLEPGSAIFIGARNKDVVVAHNQIKSTDGNGIDVRDSTPTERGPAPPEKVDIRKNKVRNAKLHGIDIDVDASTAKQYVVRGNLASRNGVGIHIGPKTPGTSLAFNTALANTTHDCWDESKGAGTAGTNSTWKRNVGRDDLPDGICDPHHREHKPRKHHKHDKHKQHHPRPILCLPWGNKPS
jgi:nitrous oxidase accessory protein NosD